MEISRYVQAAFHADVGGEDDYFAEPQACSTSYDASEGQFLPWDCRPESPHGQVLWLFQNVESRDPSRALGDAVYPFCELRVSDWRPIVGDTDYWWVYCTTTPLDPSTHSSVFWFTTRGNEHYSPEMRVRLFHFMERSLQCTYVNMGGDPDRRYGESGGAENGFVSVHHRFQARN